MSAQPRLLALATANPPYVLEQSTVRAEASRFFGSERETQRLLPVFDNSNIDRRYSCVPLEWYSEPHGWTERNALYMENAVALLEKAATEALDAAGLKASDIDMIVVASTSGIATPSLDAQLMERLPFRRDVQRLPIFGLGCAGGVLGLSRAATFARAMPESRVLYLVVELCALWFRRDDRSKSNIVATALFGDGAAAAIISCQGEGLKAFWARRSMPMSISSTSLPCCRASRFSRRPATRARTIRPIRSRGGGRHQRERVRQHAVRRGSGRHRLRRYLSRHDIELLERDQWCVLQFGALRHS